MSNTPDTPLQRPPRAERISIVPRKPKPVNSSLPTFFSFPGELRNQIYQLTLEKSYQRVPLNPFYLNKPDPYIGLLQTCSAMYCEARSYMVEQQTAYVPVMPGMDWDYGEPEEDYGLPKITAVCVLTDFMSVHFHLHIDLLRREDYDPEAVLESLAAALKVYMRHTWDIYIKHGLGNRRAVVHLDHLLSLWPKLFTFDNCVPLGALQRLVNLVAKDQMTDWEIRYYVATGQSGKTIEYGKCQHPHEIRDTDMAQLRFYASSYDNISVMAEVYGEQTEWESGEKLKAVTRTRTPVTEFWPNVHFDAGRYKFTTYADCRHNYPEHMPLENFDEEALDANQENREERKLWMQSLEKRDSRLARSRTVTEDPESDGDDQDNSSEIYLYERLSDLWNRDTGSWSAQRELSTYKPPRP